MQVRVLYWEQGLYITFLGLFPTLALFILKLFVLISPSRDGSGFLFRISLNNQIIEKKMRKSLQV